MAPPSAAQARSVRRQQDRLEDTRRREGESLLNMVDVAMTNGHVASDFAIEWRNDFFKAQTGTFVPFTLTIDRSRLSAPSALMYLRAVRRDAAAASRGSGPARYAFDVIFPVELGSGGRVVRITRAFAVPPGEYDVYVALRERPGEAVGGDPRLKAAILKQPLSVPDFWTGDLMTSSVMLADRIDSNVTAPSGDDLLERPYVIGDNEIHVSEGAAFRKNRELIVVFLIYNPTVAEGNFDVQVDYHLFRMMPGGASQETDPDGDHPAARAGERYVTRTTPQRFKPGVMDAHFDPAAGHPMMAGQGILLSSFQEGQYRIGITVTDLLSRKQLSRDVMFSVVGS
jgi:hypothetical protein